MAEGIVEVHVAPIKQKGFQQREKQVDEPNAPYGVHDARVQFVVGDAVDFGNEELHSAHAEIGQDGQREHNDGQAANPLRHAAPKKNVFRDGFEAGENGGSRGGEP